MTNPSFEDANDQSDAGAWKFHEDAVEIKSNDPNAGPGQPRADIGDKYL